MPRNSEQNEQMRAESREKIITTARQLFAERGYNGCNVSDIARQAGMSQGNIYWYFSSKEELLKAILADAFEALGMMLSEVAAHPGTGTDRLNYLIERYVDFGGQQGGIEITIIISSLTARDGLKRLSDLDVNTIQIGAGIQQAIADIIAQAQAEGGAAPRVAPDLLATFFLSVFNGLAYLYREQATNIPRDILRDAVLRLLGSERK